MVISGNGHKAMNSKIESRTKKPQCHGVTIGGFVLGGWKRGESVCHLGNTNLESQDYWVVDTAMGAAERTFETERMLFCQPKMSHQRHSICRD